MDLEASHHSDHDSSTFFMRHEILADSPPFGLDVFRIDHGDSVDDLVRFGRDIEKSVLARGVRYHVEDRVLMHGNRTIVFK